ncbi:MAG: FlgD immunoglobulin-like domain containing protein [Ignavibacteriaceae bacterium]|nr:FlgD immunoglobulin-like domain containing protein [Ignavibacteriaceae bacterium]
MKIYNTLLFVLLLSLFISGKIIAQSYQADSGSVPSGVIQSTDSFLKAAVLSEPKELMIGNEESEGYETPDFFMDLGKHPLEGSNYIKGVDQTNNMSNINSNSRLIKNFSGPGMTNAIPPDPIIAVGPDYVMNLVNTQFTIYDKNGNNIKSIDANTWLNASIPDPGIVTDPKVIYDHFDKRFVMVWLTINTTAMQAYWTVSVSHDSTPLGTWYTWALPCNLNGKTDAKNYGDYEGLGFDKDCIYITGNMFSLSTTFYMYSKLRVIPKAQLYSNTAGPLKWWDLWNITPPASSVSTFGIRPAIVFGAPAEYYLIYGSNNNGNIFTVFKLTNTHSSTAPVLSGINVTVTQYLKPSDVNQLGGSGGINIDGGTSQIRNEPVYRDGFLWAVHPVRNPTSTAYSAVHYVKINIASGTTSEDYVFGDPGYWHNYPAIMVDKDLNMAITYSQSSPNDYIGAYYTSRLATDPVGLQPSKPIQTGKGNYVVTGGGTANRWGDYNGIALDPGNNYNFWMLTEYAAATNRWGTWTGELTLTPSPHLYSDNSSVNFGSVEIFHTGDTIPVVLRNAGTVNLSITGISKQAGPFTFIDDIAYPQTLGTNDSLIIHLTFSPTSAGIIHQNLVINSNDNSYPGLTLVGRAFQINHTLINTAYASSGSNNNGDILTINTQSGAGTILGTSLYSEIRSIAIHPKAKIAYGISSGNISTEILRINAAGGDAYNFFTLPLLDVGAIAFDTSGTLYAGLHNGTIYKIDLQTRAFTQICSLGVKIQTLAFDPVTNELWGSPLVVLGTSKDILYKVNLATGDTMIVGKTGFGVQTNALTFDNSGNLFGVTGLPTQINNLISIDKNTASGTLIGSIGFMNVTGISYSNLLTNVKEQKPVPVLYNLMQNYPNPFNPTTTIEYSIPQASNVKIIIYNILGDEVNVIYNSFKDAGNYKIAWNATDRNGKKVSSGVYFYELNAVTLTGQVTSQMKKMILLK